MQDKEEAPMQDKEATQGLLNQDIELDGSYDWRE